MSVIERATAVRRPPAGVSVVIACGFLSLGGCMLQQPLPHNQQPVLGTPAAGRPNLNPTLSSTVIQDDVLGLPPESLNSLPPGSEVNRPLTPQAGELNNVRVGPATR